jgi:hypothetical protein
MPDKGRHKRTCGCEHQSLDTATHSFLEKNRKSHHCPPHILVVVLSRATLHGMESFFFEVSPPQFRITYYRIFHP